MWLYQLISYKRRKGESFPLQCLGVALRSTVVLLFYLSPKWSALPFPSATFTGFGYRFGFLKIRHLKSKSKLPELVVLNAKQCLSKMLVTKACKTVLQMVALKTTRWNPALAELSGKGPTDLNGSRIPKMPPSSLSSALEAAVSLDSVSSHIFPCF